MIRILHVIQSLSGGGAAREMLNVAEALNNTGNFEHSVCTLRTSGESGVRLGEKYGIRIHNDLSKEKLDRLIRTADIVQVEWWNNPEILRFLNSDIPGARLVIRYHVAGHQPPQNVIREYLDMADYNIVSFDELPVLTNYDERWKKKRFTKILHGADFSRLPKKVKKRSKTFNVGYIGTVSFIKMHPDFAALSSQIEIPDVKFIVCGIGKEMGLIEEIKKRHAENKFQIIGYTDQIGDIISEMDVFGYPLRPDTYASTDMVLQEVMYAGIPAVVFPYGGLLQTVKNGFNGLVVRNPKEYKEAIEFLYYNPVERERLGRNAREYVTKYLGIKNTIQQFVATYERVMQLEKSIHRWNKDCRAPLLQQPIDLSDITGVVAEKSASVLFADSLGDLGLNYKISLDSADIRKRLSADRAIARMPYLVYHNGLCEYRGYDANDPFLRLWGGLYLEEERKFGRAINEYLAAIRLGFTDWRVIWYLARSYKKAGNEQEYLKLVLQLKKNVFEFHNCVSENGKSLMEGGKWEHWGVGFLTQPRPKKCMKPEKGELIHNVGWGVDSGAIQSRESLYGSVEDLVRSGNRMGAIRALQILLKKFPDFATAHSCLGMLFYEQGEKGKAREHYEQAAFLDPHNFKFQKTLADFFYVVLGRVDDALEHYGRALSCNPEDINTLLMLGHISVSKKRFSEAIFFYEEVVRRDGRNIDARDKLELLRKLDKKRIRIEMVPGGAREEGRTTDQVVAAGARGNGQRELLWFEWAVTDFCNLNCDYCVNKGEFSMKPARDIRYVAGRDMRIAEQIFNVSDYADKIVVNLTGGEPTLSKHVIEIVSLLAKTPNICVQLITNLKLIDRIAEELKSYLPVTNIIGSLHISYRSDEDIDRIIAFLKDYRSVLNIQLTQVNHGLSKQHMDRLARIEEATGFPIRLQTFIPPRDASSDSRALKDASFISSFGKRCCVGYFAFLIKPDGSFNYGLWCSKGQTGDFVAMKPADFPRYMLDGMKTCPKTSCDCNYNTFDYDSYLRACNRLGYPEEQIFGPDNVRRVRA